MNQEALKTPLKEYYSLPQGERKKRSASLGPSWVGAASLFFFDAVLVMPGVGFILSILMTLISWLSALVLNLQESKPHAKRFFAKGGIYILAAALIFGAYHFHGWIGERNSQIVIEALHAYKANHNEYPRKLDDLIPKYLDAIPPSAYRLITNSYAFMSIRDIHHLVWVNAPVEVFTYDLDTDSLSSLTNIPRNLWRELCVNHATSRPSAESSSSPCFIPVS